MKLYFAILALLFSTILATAQHSESLSLSEFNLKGKVKSITEKQYRAKKNGKPDAEPYEEITYHFNEKGLLEMWEYKDSRGDKGSKSYDYNENGQATFMSFEGYGPHVLKYVFEQKGKTLWQYCYWESGYAAKKGDLQHKFMFTKDNSNRLVEYAKYYSTRTDFNFKEVYTYNANNQVEEMNNYGLSGKIEQRHTYIYDKNNNLVEEKEYSNTYKYNELNSTTKFEYKYDGQNNWTEMFEKKDFGKTVSPAYKKMVRTIEYY